MLAFAVGTNCLGLITEFPIEQVALRYGDENNQVAFLYTIDRIELELLPGIFRDRSQPFAQSCQVGSDMGHEPAPNRLFRSA